MIREPVYTSYKAYRHTLPHDLNTEIQVHLYVGREIRKRITKTFTHATVADPWCMVRWTLGILHQAGIDPVMGDLEQLYCPRREVTRPVVPAPAPEPPTTEVLHAELARSLIDKLHDLLGVGDKIPKARVVKS